MTESRYIIENRRMNEHHIRDLMVWANDLGINNREIKHEDIVIKKTKDEKDEWPTITVTVKHPEAVEKEDGQHPEQGESQEA